MAVENIYCVFAAVILFSVSVYGFPKRNSSSKDDFVFYSKEDWGALPVNFTRPLNTPVPFVVIHHTYIPEACHTSDKCNAAMRSMQNHHVGLGWGDIGYNFCVGSDGGAYEGRGWEVLGIHTGPANNFSVGICLIGDWRTELPPKIQLETTKALISQGISLGAVSPTYKLIGHSQAMATECPGTALLNEISTWDHFQPGPFQVPSRDNNKI